MKHVTDLMEKWIKQYFNLVYHYAYYVCSDRSLADRIVDQTFDRMRRDAQKLSELTDVKRWVIETARYFILKEVYSSWERGEDITQKYNSPDTLDPETIRELIVQYEEMR